MRPARTPLVEQVLKYFDDTCADPWDSLARMGRCSSRCDSRGLMLSKLAHTVEAVSKAMEAGLRAPRTR